MMLLLSCCCVEVLVSALSVGGAIDSLLGVVVGRIEDD